MKYAKEVIDLLAAYPGRDFRMIEIVRFACKNPEDPKARAAARQGVHQIIRMLHESGAVMISPPRMARGGFALYRWVKV